MAKYTEKEAPLLERIIMQEGLERSKAEDWARDEITRLSEENARLAALSAKASLEASQLREVLKDLIEEDEYQTCSGEEDDGIARAAARAAIREGEAK